MESSEKRTAAAHEAVDGIRAIEVVVETASLRIARLTLAPNGVVPWHWQSTVSERFVCLEGEIEVETRAPRLRRQLLPGGECAIAPKRAHTLRNLGAKPARFVVIQDGGRYDLHFVGRR